ncbi:hypothetical protein NONO_c56660 [Nocardia nova SH22a]|uniref:Uncharacterized protein n=2 Tax=Nocardia nova TaxID=37330 RepID=W5TTC2_9NOCA|nr:hypothetical protein NONO_c56660 [Nocardia nova SH22a]
MTLPGLALLIIAVAFADIAYRKATGRTALPWMRDVAGPRAAAIGFEQFDAVFDNGKRYEFDERRTVLMHRENPGDGSPGGPDVDLASGRVRMRRSD